MHLRSATALLVVALTAAACATGSGTDLADGSQTVEDATASGQVDDGEDAPVDDAAAAGDGDDPAADDAAAAGDGDDPAGGDPAADDTAADDPAAEGAGSPRVAALWWTAETVGDSSEFVAADLAGENVVLWMWAPWCSVCNREAPEVADALADLPDDVTIIGVAGRDEVGPMRDFVAEHGLGDMTHVVDVDGSVWASYGISYQPAWVFIDGDGEAAVAAGALGYDGLFEGIDEVFGR